MQKVPNLFRIAGVLVVIFAIAVSARADRRKYVWTYAYQTMPAKTTELELYQTSRLAESDLWEFRVEIEHGLTRRWDVSLYEIFAQPQGGSVKWDAMQLRTRYRLGEQGQWFADPLLYLEYNRKTDPVAPNKWEAKLILAKTVDRFNVAVDPVYELKAAPGWQNELGLDAGLSWEFSPAFTAGWESTTRMEFEHGESETASYTGPTLSFASGEWWIAAGAAWGLTEKSDDTRIRLLLGVGL